MYLGMHKQTECKPRSIKYRNTMKQKYLKREGRSIKGKNVPYPLSPELDLN